MKLKLTVLALAGAFALSANAQTEGVKNTQTVFEKDCHSNWFVTIEGGTSYMTRNNAKRSERFTFTPSLAVGKWFNPYFGARVKVMGGEAKTFDNTPNVQNNKFVNGHFDFMFDVVNFFGRNNEVSKFSVSPFLGLGYEYKFDSNRFGSEHVATANAGVQLGYRLSKRVGLVLEGETTYNGMRLNTPSHPLPYENKFRISASAGLNFFIGKVGFTPIKAQDEAQIAELNLQINQLRAENTELAKRPANCPEVVAVAPAAAVQSHFLAEKSILFKHGQSQVSSDQLITVFDASEFVNKLDGQIVVTGYMQKAESRFKNLAEKRAQAVAKILTEKYNVPSERITVEYKDSNEAPFNGKSSAWNRVVIIRSK